MRILFIISRRWGIALLAGFLFFVNVRGFEPRFVLNMSSYLTFCAGLLGLVVSLRQKEQIESSGINLSLYRKAMLAMRARLIPPRWLRFAYCLVVLGVVLGLHSSISMEIAITIQIGIAGLIAFDLYSSTGIDHTRIRSVVRFGASFAEFVSLLLAVVIPPRMLASGSDDDMSTVVGIALFLYGMSLVFATRRVLLEPRPPEAKKWQPIRPDPPKEP